VARRFLAPLVFGISTAACAQVEGLDDYEKVECLDDCPAPPPGSTKTGSASGGAPPSSSKGAQSSGSTPGSSPWRFRRAISLTSDAPTTTRATPVLVVVPPSFDATRAKPGGDDLRFSTSPSHADDLPYFVESWSPGAPSWVWVRVPSVPAGPSTIWMFYGNASASAASSFDATFPRAMRTAGGGAGSFTASGDIDVDWFELRAGDTLTLASGVALEIRAHRVILAGNVDGTGRGHAGGSVPNGAGGGPGGGGTSNPIDTEGSGGGGYGGSGGRGGEDVAGAGGSAGGAYGTAAGDDIAMGSGGGSTATGAGGAGGGALAVFGWRTTVSGIVRVNGAAGAGGFDRNAGGGAGGGILVASSFLDLAGATLAANGGAGGNCAAPAHDGGGGGGGGRVKLRRRANGSYAAPASITVAPALGGSGASTTAPGGAGGPGTIDVNESSALMRGVEAVVGAEEAS
jgi:hypothetical protein